MFPDLFLRFLLANVLRPRQKPSPKERAGAGVNRTPLLQVTTRHVAELHLERAQGALPASTACSAIVAARRELLGEVRIVLGGNRVDKRNLPAEQGKGVKQKGKGQSRSAKLERLLRD